MNESPAPPEKTPPIPTPPAPIVKPRSRFRRWSRRILKGLLYLFVLSAIAVVAFRTTQRVIGGRELNRQLAKLDAEEAGWRLEEITAAREKTIPPEGANSFPVVQRVHKLIPDEWHYFARHSQPEPNENRPYNRRFRPDELLSGTHETLFPRVERFTRADELIIPDLEKLKALLPATEEARTLALSLADMPRGGRVVEFTDDPMNFSMQPIQDLRSVLALLKDDAIEAAHGNDPRRALRAARAVLNTGRAIGDDPVAISQLVRVASGGIATTTAMHVLGLTDPKGADAELAALQAAFLAEANEPILEVAIRAERAYIDRVFENLDNGKLVKEVLDKGGRLEDRRLDERLIWWARDCFSSRDRAKYLELISKAVAHSRLPYPERVGAFTQLEQDVRNAGQEIWGLKYLRTRMLFITTQKMVQSTLRNRAALITTATGIACERFRIQHGRWPKSLEELPRSLLSEVPLDPFTGRPITLTKLPDGIAICATNSPNEKGVGGATDTGPLGGNEIGCRLFDPAARNQAAPPPKARANDLDPPTPKGDEQP